MARAIDLTAADAVSLLSRTTGQTYRLIGRLRGGETGAHEVVGPDGARLVVKWDTVEPSQQLRSEAVVFSERLRAEAAWPVPRQHTVSAEGCLFVLQSFMPGAPIEVLTHLLVDELLHLHMRRIGLAKPQDPSHWPHALIETLTSGGQGYCRHDSLRDHDDRTARLVKKIEEFGSQLRPDDLVGTDIVHWDLHPGNMLEQGGNLSAVVDTDFAVVGDAAFDLVVLALASLTLRCDQGVRSRLFDAALDGLGELRRRSYLSHLFLRFIDWSIRKDRPDAVNFWLEQAEQMLHP
jgi:aminoglycoside phosphotransferase (APT) family kinase protein